MKLPCPRFLALGLLLLTSLQAGTRETAFQARERLGAAVWSRVVRIQNESPGAGSRYPAEFHGLLVAFQGILWFYTEFDGTQTLSRYAGRLEQDQANPASLLREVEPGLALVEDVTDRPPEKIAPGLPPYACFIASVARWQQLQREAAAPTRARLLAYYPDGARQGHMVLEYWRGGRRYVFDAERPGRDREMSRHLADDPLKVAQVLFKKGAPHRLIRTMHLDLRGA